MEIISEKLKRKVDKTKISGDFSLSNFINTIVSFLSEKDKLNIIKYNKYFQRILSIDIEYYKKISGKYKIDGINGYGQEYSLNIGQLIFEGEYKNKKRNGEGREYNSFGELIFEGEYLEGKRNGKGKEYDNDGELIFEGQYLDGKRNGKGEEYLYCYGSLEFDYKPYLNDGSSYKNYPKIGFFNTRLKKLFEGEYSNGIKHGKGKEYYENDQLKFEGEYKNGKKWNGKGYDSKNNIIYQMKNGNGKVKEYYSNGKIKFEGEYLNGEKNGKVKEYNIHYEVNFYWKCERVENREFYYLEFEGEYLNGEKNGKGKEYNYEGNLVFEGDYLNGEKWNGIEKEYYKEDILKFEGELLNGEKNGKGKEYNEDGKSIFEGEYLNGERWNGKFYEYYVEGQLKFEGEYLNGMDMI